MVRQQLRKREVVDEIPRADRPPANGIVFALYDPFDRAGRDAIPYDRCYKKIEPGIVSSP